MAAAAAGQEDQALHSSLLPLTIVTTQAIETPTPLQVQPSVPPTPVLLLLQSPVPGVPAESMMAAAGIAAATTEPTPPPPPPSVYIIYTVQDGDTVDGLAARYGISPSSILWNNLDVESADSLVPGQYLRVPMSDGIIYNIGLGDTLSDIADRFGVDVQAIINFSGNNLKSADSIAENQVIFIPNGEMPTPVVTATPVPQPESPSTPVPAPLPTPPAVSPSGSPARERRNWPALASAHRTCRAPRVPTASIAAAWCSGCTRSLASQVPRSAPEQFQWAAPVEQSEMEPGDIVFFENTYPSSTRITHVGIYVGGGGVVMAVDNGDIVREVSLAESYWSAHFAGAGRAP